MLLLIIVHLESFSDHAFFEAHSYFLFSLNAWISDKLSNVNGLVNLAFNLVYKESCLSLEFSSMAFKQEVFWGNLADLLGQGKGSSEIIRVVEALDESREDVWVLRLLLLNNRQDDVGKRFGDAAEKKRGNQVS